MGLVDEHGVAERPEVLWLVPHQVQGPRRVSRKEIEDAFAGGWVVESIEPTRFEVRPDLTDIGFSPGGPKAWFVVARAVN